jgi:outer membrane protein assembly factor BamD (BamD/ComL family)
VAALFGDEREARAGDVDLARAIFAEGVKLYQRDDYEGARRLFKKAEAEHHAAPIVYNIGLRRSASVTHRPPSTRTKPTSRRSVTLPS